MKVKCKTAKVLKDNKDLGINTGDVLAFNEYNNTYDLKTTEETSGIGIKYIKTNVMSLGKDYVESNKDLFELQEQEVDKQDKPVTYNIYVPNLLWNRFFWF